MLLVAVWHFPVQLLSIRAGVEELFQSSLLDYEESFSKKWIHRLLR